MKARRVKGLDPAAPLADNAARIVRVRLDELCSFMPRAADPEEVVALHDMRIAAKRLRYVLEVDRAVFGDYAERATRMTKDLQDLLGEIHDCDVQIPEVRAFLEELEAAGRRRARGARRRGRRSRPAAAPRDAPHRRDYAGLAALARAPARPPASCSSSASSSSGTTTSARASARGWNMP